MRDNFDNLRDKITALALRAWQPDWRPGVIALVLLCVVYAETLQPLVSSSAVPYTQDAAEIQVVLNFGGTLHATGYPLYTLTGIPLVRLFRLAGVNPATPPAIVSLLWSLLALALIYELLAARTGYPVLAAASIFLLGLSESFWLHSVIPEVYSLQLVFVTLILRLVLRHPDREWQRKDWLQLALLLGLGIAHHRAIAFLVPALALYLWPQFWRMRRDMPRTLALGIGLFVAGFLPYVYMPLYARLSGVWVHGDPGTLNGFLTEFFGNEFGYLFEPPVNVADFITRLAYITSVLGRVLSWPVFAAGTVSLIALATRRRAGILLALATLAYVGFITWVPETVLPEAFLLPAQVMLVMALCEGLDWLLSRWPARSKLQFGAAAILAALALVMAWRNVPTIHALTHDPAGVEYLTLLSTLQPDPEGRDTVLMVPLGWRYNVAGYGLYVTHTYSGVELVDHRADFAAILQRGDRLLVTPETLYAHPREWWQDAIGLPIHLRSGGPGFVEISPDPLTDIPAGDPVELDNGITLLAYDLTHDDTSALILTLYWSAEQPPGENFSVFVHLLDEDSETIVAQADSYAPVEGFYPVTDWQPGEVVRDAYRVVAPVNAAGPYIIRAGMYRQLDDGTFENFEALNVEVP